PQESAADLDQVAEMVRNHYRALVIQGHCSPDEAVQDPAGGHDLAFRRAAAVRQALEERAIAAARLRLVSCAAHSVPRDLMSTDKRLVVITMGSYLLPTENDVLDLSLPNQVKNVNGPHP